MCISISFNCSLISSKINSNLYRFEKFISEKYNFNPSFNYQKILNWSIKNSPEFWDELWKFCRIKGLKGSKKFIRSSNFYKNNFLPNYKLNFTENILSKNDNSKAIHTVSFD